MAFLSDSCTFHELTDDILAACQPFSCGNEDLDDFFAHDATRKELTGGKNIVCQFMECAAIR